MGRYDFISAAFYNEAKNEVEEKLRKQQLTKPLTPKEMATWRRGHGQEPRIKAWCALRGAPLDTSLALRTVRLPSRLALTF